ENLADQRQGVGRDVEGVVCRQQVQQRHGEQGDKYDAEGDGGEFRAGLLHGGQGEWLVQSMTLPLRANRPCGRFWMNRMISARIRILPSTAPICGSRILLAIPKPNAAKMLPASWPTPPSTTTRKESMM